MTKLESEVENLKEKFELLKSKVDLLEILAKQPKAAPVEEGQIKLVKLKQINIGGKKYFCKTIAEQQAFVENHPGAKTESFDIEVQVETAEKYLADPENMKQFARREAVNV
jgi:hypothetical protein